MQRKVRFCNRRGETLVGVLHGAPGAYAVVCCHGMFSSKDGRKHLAVAAALQRQGVPVLRLDFAGAGESDGSLYDLSYSRRMEDLDAALSFLAAAGVERFGLFGSSMGGAVAYLTAARDERVVSIATLAAVAHPAALLERYPEALSSLQARGYYDVPQGRVGRGIWEDSLAHDVVSAVSVLHAPVLVIHGELDDIVPSSDAHDIATAARRASLDLVYGADHSFSRADHLRPTIERIAAFLSPPGAGDAPAATTEPTLR